MSSSENLKFEKMAKDAADQIWIELCKYSELKGGLSYMNNLEFFTEGPCEVIINQILGDELIFLMNWLEKPFLKGGNHYNISVWLHEVRVNIINNLTTEYRKNIPSIINSFQSLKKHYRRKHTTSNYPINE